MLIALVRAIISAYRGTGEQIAFSRAGSEKGHAGKNIKGHGVCDSGQKPYQASPTVRTAAPIYETYC